MQLAGQIERDAFSAQNRMRTDPRSFIEIVSEQILQFDPNGKILNNMLMTNEGIGAWAEAKNSFARQEYFESMTWSDEIAQASRDHCLDTGPSGVTGHTGTKGSQPWDRMNRYGKWGGTVGENIAYGNSRGDEYILQLYIDDGVPGRGHRKNILNPAFKVTGMFQCYHKLYGGALVIGYAGTFTPNN